MPRRNRQLTGIGLAVVAVVSLGPVLGACTKEATVTSTATTAPARSTSDSTPATTATSGEKSTTTRAGEKSTTTSKGGGTKNVMVSGDTTIDATVGETLNLSVEQNTASTGYSWSASTSSPALQAEGSKTEASGGPPGSPGTEVFTFKAVSTGTSVVTFSLKPPGSQPATKTYKVTVNIT